MTQRQLLFKSWVPEWLIKVAILMVLLPSFGLFGLSIINVGAAAGYYGIEPADVQYSMVILYAAVASFFALEKRFSNFIASRHYLLWGTILQIATSYLCYFIHNLPLLFICRFLQGLALSASVSICMTLIFNRLDSERSREIGYSVFYGVLLCATPFTSLVTAPITDAFDYNALYKWLIFMFPPGTLLLFTMMRNIRLNRKIPLYQVDWPSFVIYGLLLCILGYVLVYGQSRYWLQDKRILLSCLAALALFTLHVLRQINLRRPYLSLRVFKYRNFRLGTFYLFILYLCRGALNITTTYFAIVLKLDPIHIAYLLLANILGIIGGAVVSSRLILVKGPTRLVWMAGLTILLIFHIWMRLLFTSQANVSVYILPLIAQGLGIGLLMAPIVVFMVSSVPASLGGTASATGIFFRFLGFCTSFALINYFSLFRLSQHYDRFLQSLTALDPGMLQRTLAYRQALIVKGMVTDQAAIVATSLLKSSVNVQVQLRYMIDYYEMMSWLILGVILFIAPYPYFKRTVMHLQNPPS
ncbi:MAG TPA: MFS transporter [Patescibacteria group bacterium]